jgi:hypothetical protein
MTIGRIDRLRQNEEIENNNNNKKGYGSTSSLETMEQSEQQNIEISISQEPPKGPLRQLLSRIGHIKRPSWRQMSTNNSMPRNDDSAALLTDQDESIISEERSTTNTTESTTNSTECTTNSTESTTDFLKFFVSSAGPPQIVFLCMLWALALGATDAGAPGARSSFFYGAYFYDLDGNKICICKFS